jgi:hypothetical protein
VLHDPVLGPKLTFGAKMDIARQTAQVIIVDRTEREKCWFVGATSLCKHNRSGHELAAPLEAAVSTSRPQTRQFTRRSQLDG